MGTSGRSIPISPLEVSSNYVDEEDILKSDKNDNPLKKLESTNSASIIGQGNSVMKGKGIGTT